MGRQSLLVLLLASTLPGCTSGSVSARSGDIVLLPHHLIVEPLIKQTYADLTDESWREVILICPDHFHQGTSHISTPHESEFGCQIHEDYVEQTWPGMPVTSYMIQTSTTKAEVDSFVDTLAQRNALFIFSVDFSHYLPGDVAYVHDLRSMDVLASRSIEDARSLEVDSPIALEIMLRLLERRNETLDILKNTNPARDAGIDTFENTTHIFARSRPLLPGQEPPSRQIQTTLYLAHPRDWYLGKTQEDRYLYGYDSVLWNQGGTDHAIVTTTGQVDQIFSFAYFQ